MGAFYALWMRRYRLARVCAGAQVTFILLGWALAQFPYLVEPDITITSAAASRVPLQLLLGALAVGAILLFPSYYYLFRVFKDKTA
jgi:cytochrome d ubiquinol oxidase subunit II